MVSMCGWAGPSSRATPQQTTRVIKCEGEDVRQQLDEKVLLLGLGVRVGSSRWRRWVGRSARGTSFVPARLGRGGGARHDGDGEEGGRRKEGRAGCGVVGGGSR